MDKAIEKIISDKKNLCVFAGAGVSIKGPTNLPSFSKLNASLIKALCGDQVYNEEIEEFANTIHAKPEQLLQHIWDYTDGAFNPVAGFRQARYNANHQGIAQWVKEGVKCIITTNFDPCIEKALDDASLKDYSFYSGISESIEQSLTRDLQGGKVVLWKPHGDCRDIPSLCYTKSKVARMINSASLYRIISFITHNYNIIFLGYSGYDDDIYPMLRKALPASGKKVVWNTHSAPGKDSPPAMLQADFPNRVHITTGDVRQVLHVAGQEEYSDETVVGHPSYWEAAINTQVGKTPRSLSLSIVSKYFSIYNRKISEHIWEKGLLLPKEETRDEDVFRFKYNLGQITSEDAFKYALESHYFQIAETALSNIFQNRLNSQKFDECLKCLEIYQSLSMDANYSKFFTTGLYSYYSFLLSHEKIKNSILTARYTQLFQQAYTQLQKEGRISLIGFLIDQYYSSLSTRNRIDPNILNELINFYHILEPYNELPTLAGLCFCIGGVCARLGEKQEIRLSYNDLTLKYTEMSHSWGTYDDENYHEKMAYVYQQRSTIENGIENCLIGLSHLKLLPEDSYRWTIECALYANLTDILKMRDYDRCIENGKMAISIARKCNNLFQEGRVLYYMATADLHNGKRIIGEKRLKAALKIYRETGETTGELYDLAKEYNIIIDKSKFKTFVDFIFSMFRLDKQ